MARQSKLIGMDGGEFSWGGVLTKCFVNVIKSVPETISQFVCGAKRLSSRAKAHCSALLMSGLKLRPLIYETDANQYSTTARVRASFE